MNKYSKEEAKIFIANLVDRFETHKDSYKKGAFNETQTRTDYINPLFTALGWDINNSEGLAEAYREVIHEDKIKVGGATKAPDYCFTIYGQKKFFVEAKKPGVSIKDAPEPAFQLRRYGWSAKLPISIITDFEEFAIYDCSQKPNSIDKASVSRIKYFTFKDYIKEFDFLWDTFAKENVLKGSFDKFISSSKDKKGTAGVDAEFLKTLDSWRDALARNIVNRNPEIGEEELNFSLQKILDRIIFLRISEDRGVEDENNLLSVAGAPNVYESLKRLFHVADEKYNSGLFDYKKDLITDKLNIDDKTLKAIIEEMYYPKSPYEFSVIPVEILGHSYEQYLGKVIRITAGHRTKIEEKPEVRKAGGVYYTPQYIVDYIVKNTVGKLVEGKTPEEVAKLKICDPACGSGSFLLGAYQYLLDWHLEYYLKKSSSDIKNIGASPNASERMDARGLAPVRDDCLNDYPSDVNYIHKDIKKNIGASPNASERMDARGLAPVRNRRNINFLTPDGKLSSAIKKQILLNNIYGVDIDTNAVEVTKLSLMLKAMEGETKASINSQLSLTNERVLPTLDNNIKSGNSLIDLDFYNNQIDFAPEAEKKIKPFNWENSFPEVFKDKTIDKELSAYHVTWATFNSRVSERMIEYESVITQRRLAKGEPEIKEPRLLNSKEELFIANSIKNICLKYGYRIIGMNICKDHIHLAIVCNEADIPNIVKTLKSISSRELNIYNENSYSKKDIGASPNASGAMDARGLAPVRDDCLNDYPSDVNYIHKDIKKNIGASPNAFERMDARGLAPVESRGLTQTHLWQAKFNSSQIKSNEELYNVLAYIKDNRIKHNLEENQELKSVINSFVIDINAAFAPIVEKGGFDAIIGNPPYGAELPEITVKYLQKKFPIGNTDTAALFMILAKELLKPQAYNGFIIPKAFTYASNWAKIRNILLPDIVSIVDCSKVWKEVKLEMSIYISQKDTFQDTFESSIRKNQDIIAIGHVNKTLCNEFEFILNGVSEKEIELGLKIKRNCICLNDLAVNKRGGMFQSIIKDVGECNVIGGKQIGRFLLSSEIKGKINRSDVNESNSLIKENSILVQNIVAHIMNPFPHLKIISTILENAANYVILDTINQLEVSLNIKNYFILGILNSKLTSWYVYKFIYANAIRTMHFDSTTTKKVPIPKIDINNKIHKQTHDALVSLVETMLQLNKDLQKAVLPEQKEHLQARINYTDKKIDQLVYKLYDLTEEEIKIVEEG